MKEHETTGEVLKPQQSPSIPAVQPQELVAELLRDRLATKLTEDELTSLISEVGVLTSGNQKSPVAAPEDWADRLKSRIDYIEYKCRDIEKTLRATDRHVKREAREREERILRDRSPLRGMVFGDGLMYGGLNPIGTITSTITTRTTRNPWLDSYFS
jgi:hypothetical protein